jgi:sensor histidine kinase regulating citrate/malate metabolism
MLSSVSEILKENKINNEKKLIQKRKTLEYEYYTKIEENNIRIRKLHHDMKNHLLCISGLCEDAKSKEYIAKLTENLSKLDHTVKTGNKVLDIILSEKKQICDEKGIRFDTSVNFSKSDFMDMIDVSAIFHNTIDNAILACEKIPDGGKIEKKIEIKVKYINKFCIIKISNTKVNEIKKKNGRFLTNKKEKESHGFGISNVEDSVRKYGGEMYIEYTDDTFTVNILILTNQIPEREPELAQANN